MKSRLQMDGVSRAAPGGSKASRMAGMLAATALACLGALAGPPADPPGEPPVAPLELAPVAPPRLTLEPVATLAAPVDTAARPAEVSAPAAPLAHVGYDATPQLSKVNQEAAQARLEASGRRITPEEAGGPGAYLKRQPGWRGVVELFNPFAPMPRAETPAATAFETRVPLRTLEPRVPTDGIRPAGGLTFFSFTLPR